MRVLQSIFFSSIFFFCGLLCAQDSFQSFTNPLLPSGADPFSFYKDGWYYYTNTVGNRLILRKTDNIAHLKDAEQKTIFTPPQGTSYSKEIWAPEILFINKRWYAYFAADSGSNNSHRLYVLENASPDPMEGDWTLKGRVGDASNKWAIDGDVFEYRNKWYMIWSGWEGDTNGQQNIYIARLKNPWTVDGERIQISSPTKHWETHGDLHDAINPPHVNVNEGPQALQHDGKLFIVYSASGCWTDYYALGLLSFTGKKNLLDTKAWKKSPEPVFRQSPENGVYAPGHNSFFKSPDGTEDWILYHANSRPGQGCGRERSPRAQPFSWNPDGTPNFGAPVKEGVAIPIPSQAKNGTL